MEFKEYSSIENAYRQKEIQRAFEQYPEMKYVVQEKVHGANFSFWYNHSDKTIKCAKRSGFIVGEENFFNHKKVLAKYQDQLLEMGELIGANYTLFIQ